MAKIPDRIETWQMVEPGKLARVSLDVPEIKPGEVLVEIAGCGVCHTDLGYFFDSVPTVSPPPLTLGHEISGQVVAGDSSWVGKEVIIPAAMPCNSCPVCAAGLLVIIPGLAFLPSPPAVRSVTTPAISINRTAPTAVCIAFIVDLRPRESATGADSQTLSSIEDRRCLRLKWVRCSRGS